MLAASIRGHRDGPGAHRGRRRRQRAERRRYPTSCPTPSSAARSRSRCSCSTRERTRPARWAACARSKRRRATSTSGWGLVPSTRTVSPLRSARRRARRRPTSPARERVAPPRRGSERADYQLGHVQLLHRLSEERRVRTLLGRDRRPARRHAAVGGGHRHERREAGVQLRPAYTSSSAEILRTLLAAGADPYLTTDDGTTPLMAAAGRGRATYTPRVPRGTRSPMAEEAVRLVLEAGADVNAVNEADFTALHGAAFCGLNEVVAYLVATAPISTPAISGAGPPTGWPRARSSRSSSRAGPRQRPCWPSWGRHEARHPRHRVGTPARRAAHRRPPTGPDAPFPGTAVAPDCASSSREHERRGAARRREIPTSAPVGGWQARRTSRRARSGRRRRRSRQFVPCRARRSGRRGGWS